MLNLWGIIIENAGTIAVAAVLCVIVAAIIVSMVRRKKRGGCITCPDYPEHKTCPKRCTTRAATDRRRRAAR